MKINKPPKWTDVYPRGTKEGDEECRFFKVLERNPDYSFQSTEAIAKEAKLTPERVERIIIKYFNKKMVIQNPNNDEQWGYWERHTNLLKETPSLVKEDHKKRIDGATKSQQTLPFFQCQD